jgi:hypothetical protein
MPVQMFPDGLEPADPSVIIWRLMDCRKFLDLITTSEMYFRRADLYSKAPQGDEYEGLPPSDYLPYAV